MTGLTGKARIVGLTELPPTRKPSGAPLFSLEQWALLARSVIEDAGLPPTSVDGIVTTRLAESARYAPAAIAEYLGIDAAFAEIVELAGASAVGMIGRAAAAIELGYCRAVLAVIPGSSHYPISELRPREASQFETSSPEFGSPQAEFEIPFGHVGQNALYAEVANLYAARYGYDPEALAKISVDQRTNALVVPDAVFAGKPLTIEDVLASPMVADPIHMLEIVMPCHGGAAVLIVDESLAADAAHAPVAVTGFGEQVTYKSPTHSRDLMTLPLAAAASRAFAMAGADPSTIDMASLYDCYTITVLMSLEAAGFCDPGTGAEFVRSHDLTYCGDFPVNTWGGQLSFGQAGTAGGMHHVCDAVRQLSGRALGAQVRDCRRAFVSGNGGIMSEQNALVLERAA